MMYHEVFSSSQIPSTIMTMFDQPVVYHDPYGVVLVIGAWNYPLQLGLLPISGNTTHDDNWTTVVVALLLLLQLFLCLLLLLLFLCSLLIFSLFLVCILFFLFFLIWIPANFFLFLYLLMNSSLLFALLLPCLLFLLLTYIPFILLFHTIHVSHVLPRFSYSSALFFVHVLP